ncbi:sugar phosphate isomerase/epimerase family protein [Algoriphagus sp. C2-6-M1]|uniref:sugar phosphate isomerase/epimerase family protein n=1 Tax=Algoriphagus persicinus TaxID=3108754 RepID=UPI002B37B196|nr:sugar phosphate isomerase/epimerase family protein [Algoriphagus sp. C2-6-M1]MEB2780867.1 sugar phosphate isomerase/epimerase family protein [Algoriphagus sp. C2-6-M1]
MKRNHKEQLWIIVTLLVLVTSFPLVGKSQQKLPVKLKTSLNAYSFNGPLMKGEMNLDDLLEYCAVNQFDAVDITAYYFPGYPEVPSDEYLYHIKQKAFLLGLEISGTGVRNDFSDPDPAVRQASVELVKNWILAAEKLGVPVIRVFSGTADVTDIPREKVIDYMVADLKECVEFGKAHGVIVGIQNHHDFLKTADETIEIIKRVNSDWFGLILDIGSFRTDAYQEIEKAIPYAVSWQLKENLYVNGIEQKTDLDKVMAIIQKSSYRGYIPLETLGEGDPKVKVSVFLKEIRNAMK